MATKRSRAKRNIVVGTCRLFLLLLLFWFVLSSVCVSLCLCVYVQVYVSTRSSTTRQNEGVKKKKKKKNCKDRVRTARSATMELTCSILLGSADENSVLGLSSVCTGREHSRTARRTDRKFFFVVVVVFGVLFCLTPSLSFGWHDPDIYSTRIKAKGTTTTTTTRTSSTRDESIRWCNRTRIDETGDPKIRSTQLNSTQRR